MKITKSQLRKMIKESVQEQSLALAFKQKQTAHYALVCVHNTPYIKEHKNLESKKQLLEFFGPFKKLGVADLEKMGQEKEQKGKEELLRTDVRLVQNAARDVEQARKVLSTVKLTDLSSVDKALEDYVARLFELYGTLKDTEADPKTRATANKSFAAAAYTLQSLSRSLNAAANRLFQAVPKSSGVYSAGREAQDIESAQKRFMMGPGQQLASLGRAIWGGPGAVRGGMSVGRRGAGV